MKFNGAAAKALLDSVSNMQSSTQKEYLRNTIKHVFDLESKDIIIFKQNEIFIKRWGGAPLIPPQLIDAIQEMFIEESKKNESSDSSTDNVNINTKGLFERFGIPLENLSPEIKERIKQRVKEQLKMSEKDVVLFLNDKMVIKKFKQSPEEEERIRREQIRSSLSKEKLSMLKRSIFENMEAEREIINGIAERILENELDFRIISHDYFTKNYIKVFQTNIVDFLKEYMEEEDVTLEVLASLLIKENWMLIHKKMALSIQELVTDKNPNAEAFLKKYSGEVEVDENRNKFRMPEIIDKSGAKWHLSTITSILMQRIKIHETTSSRQAFILTLIEQITELSHKIEGLNEEIGKVKKDLDVIETENRDVSKEEAQIEKELSDLKWAQNSCQNDDERKKIQTDIREKTLTLKKVTVKEDALYENRKKLEIQNKLLSQDREKLKFDLSRLEKRRREEESKIAKFLASQKDLDEKFESMNDALAIALTKRGIKV